MNKFENAETLLKVENLCQYFKLGRSELKAVDNVSFDIKKGEVFGLVGESGCGKTTTGRTIIKLYDATSGNVYFKGERIVAGIKSYKDNIASKKAELRKALDALDKSAPDYEEKKSALETEANAYIAFNKEEIKKARHDQKCCDKDYQKHRKAEILKEYEAKIAGASDDEKAMLEKERDELLKNAKKERLVTKIQMIFQDPIASLDPRMTVRDIIAEGLVIHGEKNKAVIDEKVLKMLDLVGLLPEHAGRYPHEFSGGQRQRIGIARALVLKPDFIIADEPISALDVSIQAQVINLLNELRDSLGLTIMFIAHDLSVVKYFSDRIGVMYFGTMVELASSDELFAHPLHPYTKSLLSAIPLPDPYYEKRRQRITYNALKEHDYSVDKPSMREISPDHFVFCNDAEEEKYKKELSNG